MASPRRRFSRRLPIELGRALDEVHGGLVSRLPLGMEPVDLRPVDGRGRWKRPERREFVRIDRLEPQPPLKDQRQADHDGFDSVERPELLGPQTCIQIGATVEVERANRRRELLQLLNHLLGGRPILDEKRLGLRVSGRQRQQRDDLGLFGAGLERSQRIENRSLLLVSVGEPFQVFSDRNVPKPERREGGREAALSVAARPISFSTKLAAGTGHREPSGGGAGSARARGYVRPRSSLGAHRRSAASP